MVGSGLRGAVFVLGAMLLAGCGSDDGPAPASAAAGVSCPAIPTSGTKYNASVCRTALGIPHIKAADFGGLGYGLGYAQAEDNLCTVLDDIVTDRGERARYFGPDGSYSIPANGVTVDNVTSDFFWKFAITPAAIANLRTESLTEAQDATDGFRHGFNRYVREIRSGAHAGRHAACRNADWLIELDADDMYRRYLRLALIASSSALIAEIVSAQPPSGGEGEAGAAAPLPVDRLAAGLRESALARFDRERRFGSNMYAIGAQGSTSGQPLVFGNPHFPWSGTERLYIFHATLPGTVDIMGAALYGVPAVLIGFTDHFAWSHTVSTAWRFTFYELTLSPESPTQYVYDGEVRDIEAVPVTIKVKQADGTLADRTRTMYRSHFGPMLKLAAADGADLLPWNESKAYTIRDANAENDRLINQFFHWNKAKSLSEFIALHKSILGIPWVNTVASGPNGKAYYGDVSVVPNVPNAKLAACANNAPHQAVQQVVPGLPVLDGSVSVCEWDSDDDAPAPGIFGPGKLPSLERDDWVHNCNDSYWLSNPAAPLTGYAGIIGAYDGRNPANERYPRSMRTRLCIQHALRHLGQTGADTRGPAYDANGDKKFDLAELQETVLSSQIYTAQLARDDIVDNTCAAGTVLTQNGPVDVEHACTVLGKWSMQSNLTDVGSHIWREFFAIANATPGNVVSNPALWRTPFNPSDPVNTPRDIAFASPQVQDALGRAVSQIETKGFALDAPVGELQYSGVIGDTFIPIFGGTGSEGAFTIVATLPPESGLRSKTDDDRGGYKIRYGNSYIQTVTWEPEGGGFKPVAAGFITYSQSTDPASPYFTDFTREYSAKRWHAFPFREADVAAQTQVGLQLTE